MSGIDISVVIATRDRRASLLETLEDLARQDTGGQFRYEVIVADNGSSDGTAEAVARLGAGYPAPLRIVREPRPGKAHALNSGIAAAAGEYVAMTDDDVSVGPGWLDALYWTLKVDGSDGAGGPVHPLWLGPRPAWLNDLLLRQLGMVDYGPAPAKITDPGMVLIGPNCAYRTALFRELGGFNPDNPVEDSDWFLRAFHAGRRLAYQPDAVVLHKIDGRTITPRGLARRFFRHGRGYGMMLRAHRPSRSLRGVPLWVFRLVAELHCQAAVCRLRGDLDRARWHWLRRWFYFGVIAHGIRA